MGITYNSEFDTVISGTITGVSQNLDITTGNTNTKSIQITGTWVGTLVAQATVDGTNWVDLSFLNLSNYLYTASTTTNGLFLIPSNAFASIRIFSSAWTSGTATINSKGSDSASLISSKAHIVGATTGTLIGNSSDSLKVTANITNTAPTGYSKKLVYVDMNASSGGVARGTSITSATWVDVFSYSGSGVLTNFNLNIETKTLWLVRLLVDGEEIFGSAGLSTDEMISDTLYDMDEISQTNLNLFTGLHDTITWGGPLGIPINYSTSVVLKVKRSAGAPNKKFQAGLIVLTKDT